jgi:hypothetical protein
MGKIKESRLLAADVVVFTLGLLTLVAVLMASIY